MTQQEIIQNLLNEVETRIRSGNVENVTFNLIKEILYETFLDLQYVIVSKGVNSSSTSIDDFHRIVAQNIVSNKEIDPSDVQGEQIIRQLSHEGWIIIPPP